jgi:hypothetical protein
MPKMNMLVPTNLIICLDTIKEVSNLSILPKGAIDWILNQVGIIKSSMIFSGSDDPNKTIKSIA